MTDLTELRIKTVIKEIAKEEFDFHRIWTLGQNHRWYVTVNGSEYDYGASWRYWGTLLSEIDGDPSTDYMTYYCSFLNDARTERLKLELLKFKIRVVDWK